MIQKIALGFAAFVLAFSFSACDAGDGLTYENSPSRDTDTYYSPSDPGGLGMTYNGKMGYDMGGGLVLPYDGSAPSLGYGF